MTKSIKRHADRKKHPDRFCRRVRARNRYSFFAKQARKEGFVQISKFSLKQRNKNSAHASTLFKMLDGGEVEITATYPAGRTGTTLENLREAAGGEHHEWDQMYPAFAKTAREEGFPEVAQTMMAIAVAEKTTSAAIWRWPGISRKARSSGTRR